MVDTLDHGHITVYYETQGSGGSGSSSGITIQDEGSDLSNEATILNFVGAGVTASGTGTTKTITINGASGGSSGISTTEVLLVDTNTGLGKTIGTGTTSGGVFGSNNVNGKTVIIGWNAGYNSSKLSQNVIVGSRCTCISKWT